VDTNFDKCLSFVFKWEGGYSCNPLDPGGETNFGISKKAYPDLDIAHLTSDMARAIYYRDYWVKAGCNEHRWPMDLIVFDTAVNLGVKRAMVMFQDNQTPLAFLFARIRFYIEISGKTKDRFLRGWIRRILDLYDESRKIY